MKPLGTPRTDWPALDWSKSTSFLAWEIGCTPVHVSRMRATHAPETVSARKKPVDWIHMDWEKSSKQISDETGFGARYISLIRAKHAPGTLQKNKTKKAIDWEAIDWSMSTARIAKLTSRSVNYVSTVRQKLRRANSRWDSAHSLGPILHSALHGKPIPLDGLAGDQLQKIADAAKRLRSAARAVR